MLAEDALALLESLEGEADLILTDPPTAPPACPGTRNPLGGLPLPGPGGPFRKGEPGAFRLCGGPLTRVMRPLAPLLALGNELVWPKRCPTGFPDTGRRPLAGPRVGHRGPRPAGGKASTTRRSGSPACPGARCAARAEQPTTLEGGREPVPYEDDGTRHLLSVLPRPHPRGGPPGPPHAEAPGPLAVVWSSPT